MARKSLGYVENIWTCPNCGTKNKGSEKFCTSCGAAMPKSSDFEHAQGAEIIKDEKKIAAAKAGADAYCPYCGNRNAGDAKVCANCGADLTGAEKRKSGEQYRVSDGVKGQSTKCPVCGTENPLGSMRCQACNSPLASAAAKVEDVNSEEELAQLRKTPSSATPSASSESAASSSGGKKKGNGCLFIILAIVVIGIAFFLFSSMGSKEEVKTSAPIKAAVTGMEWNTAVEVLELQDETGQDWRDEIDPDYEIQSCTDKERYRSDDEVAGSEEECGEPYYEDLGNGYSELVQDCVYVIYDDYCTYTYSDWGVDRVERASGTDDDPYLPKVSVDSDTREGDQSASYTVYLTDENGQQYTINPGSLDEYQSYDMYEEFEISVNNRGNIVNMEKK